MPYDKIAKKYTLNLAASMKQASEKILNDLFTKEYSKYRIERGTTLMDSAALSQLKSIPLQSLYDLWLVGVGERVGMQEALNKLENNDYIANVGQYLYEAGAIRLNPVTDEYYLIPLSKVKSCKS
jgi:hypothetical protein